MHSLAWDNVGNTCPWDGKAFVLLGLDLVLGAGVSHSHRHSWAGSNQGLRPDCLVAVTYPTAFPPTLEIMRFTSLNLSSWRLFQFGALKLDEESVVELNQCSFDKYESEA